MAPVAAGWLTQNTFVAWRSGRLRITRRRLFYEYKIRWLDKHLNIEYSVHVMRDDEEVLCQRGFKALVDPTRRRILELLREGNCTAGELAEHFDISKPSLSHHLATLKTPGW